MVAPYLLDGGLEAGDFVNIFTTLLSWWQLHQLTFNYVTELKIPSALKRPYMKICAQFKSEKVHQSIFRVALLFNKWRGSDFSSKSITTVYGRGFASYSTAR